MSTPAIPVFLLHVGRSGSQVLGDLLSQHPRVAWGREVFMTSKSTGSVESAGPTDDLELHRQPLVVIARHLARVGEDLGKTHSVLSVKYFHLEYTGTTLDDLGRMFSRAEYVLLRRRNILRKIVSSQLAHARGLWHHHLDRPSEAAALARVATVRVDPRSLLIERPARLLVEYLDWYSSAALEARRFLFTQARREPLCLDYEDDVEVNPLVAHDKVVEYLGLPHHPPTVRLGRTTPRPLREVLENFDQVAEALRGTAYEWMLDG